MLRYPTCFSQYDENGIRMGAIINMIPIILIYSINVTPFLMRMLPKASTLLLFFVWLLLSVLRSGIKSFNDEGNNVAIWWMALIGWEFIMYFIVPSLWSINAYLFKIPAYLMPLMLIYIISTYKYKEINLLIVMMISILAVNILDNIKIGIENPALFGTIRDDDLLAFTNGGGTSFIITGVFFIPCCYSIYKLSKRKIIRYVAAALGVLTVYYFTAINTRGTVFFCFLFFVFAILLSKQLTKNSSRACIYGVLIFILLISYQLCAVFLLRTFADFIPSERLVMRIDSIINSLERGGVSDDDAGSLYDRVQLSLASLSTWLSGPINFLVGIGNKTVAYPSEQNLIKLGIGQHSQIIDYLAKYGILGTFILFKALKRLLQYVASLTYSIKIRYVVYAAVGSFILMSVLNNTFFVDTMYTMFIMLALIVYNGERENL